MANSSIDMTTFCNNCEAKTRDLLLLQEKYETIHQERHELKRKVEVIEKVQSDYENDMSFLSNKQSEDVLNLQNELESKNTKIQKLKSMLEDERLNNQSLRREVKEEKEKNKVQDTKPVIVHDQEEIGILTAQIDTLEKQEGKNRQLIQQLEKEKDEAFQFVRQFKSEKQHLEEELRETKECLQQKINDLQNVKTSLESVREEKLVLNSELQVLKASDTNAARGNSLFAEVEDNRQKVVAQREILKMKYLNLKKVLSQKQVENNKLKLEVIKIRREEKDDEKSLHEHYSDLIHTYKAHISELENEIIRLQKNTEQTPAVFSGDNNNQFSWVNTVVENERKKGRTLQAELNRRVSDYVTQGHQLFDSQKENRKLKAVILKMQSEIDELRLDLDAIKSANETVGDGISPPAIDVVVEYQRQKHVKFQETMQKCSAPSLSEEKDSDKEN